MAKRMINTMRIASAYSGGRRRDERGRYMNGGEDMRRSGGYSRNDPDMRMPGVYPSETRRDRRRSDMGEDPEMRGEGYFVWDGMDQHHPPVENTDPGYWRQGDREESKITDMREYGRRYSPQSHMDNTQHHRQMTQQRQIGFRHHEGDEKDHLTRHQAEAWVDGMKDKAKWKRPEDVKTLAQRLGITGEDALLEFWAVLNATYSDICKVAKKYNVDRSDFYADMAHALFLADEDAVEGKPVLYYEYLVDKDKE